MKKFNKFIGEGLIKSYDKKVLLDNLEKLFTKYDRVYDFDDYGDTLLLLTRGKTWQNDSNDEQLINSFISILRTTGWYINTFKLDFTTYTTKFSKDIIKNNFLKLNFSLVRIYDKKVNVIPEILYHVTSNNNIEKIEKQGLVPKSKNKIEYHLDRVYLTSNYDIAVEFLTILEDDYINDVGYVILTINTTEIKDMKLYYDPTYYYDSDENDDTFYTYDNIHPNYITIE